MTVQLELIDALGRLALEVKFCGGCSSKKSLHDFSPKASRCKPCLAAARRARREANPELDRRNEQRWDARNRERRRVEGRAKYWRDPELHRNRRREYGQRPSAKQMNMRREAARRATKKSATIVPFTAEQLAARLWAHSLGVRPS